MVIMNITFAKIVVSLWDIETKICSSS